MISIAHAGEPAIKAPIANGTYVLTAIMGTIKVIKSDNPLVTMVQCNYPYTPICIYKAAVIEDNMPICATTVVYTDISGYGLDQSKTYMGIPTENGINFIIVDRMSASCNEDGSVQFEISPAIVF
ncbi:MAG: hypothetical protein WCO28_01395 [Bacteroidota bacterium]